VAKQVPPSQLIEDTKQRLQEIQNKVSAATEQIGYASEVVSATEPVWRAMDKPIQSKHPNEIVASGDNVLLSINEQVKDIDIQADNFLHQAHSIAGSVEILSSTAQNTASFAGVPTNYNPESLARFQYSFDRHDSYADKLEKVNPAMAVTFRGIKNNYLIKSHDHIRTALFETRQVFDQLFDALAQDDEGKTQLWWKPEDPEKPDVVTRTQRIRYAAEKNVAGGKKQIVLIEGSKHMLDIYTKLQMLHKRKALDDAKAKDAILEMLTLIREWVDYINL